MKKILSLFVVMFLLTTFNVFALSESDSGPQNITVCYMTGMGDVNSGDAVVLQTTSPTYWGREVTGSDTRGVAPYGIVLDNPTAAQGSAGTWVRVQTHGYVDGANVIALADSGAATSAVNQALVMAGTTGLGTGGPAPYNKLILGKTAQTTAGTVALEVKTIPVEAAGGAYSKGTRIKAFLKGL